MKRFAYLLISITVFITLALPGALPALGQASTAEITLLDRDGKAITQLTDGDAVSLRVTLPQQASQATSVTFDLSGSDQSIAECSIPSGSVRCDTPKIAALGWYWDASGNPQPSRAIQAQIGGAAPVGELTVTVSPRPVVMIHGFISNASTWESYLGPSGYLASVGIRGFAVGDGQVAGTLNTGRIENPEGRTNTMAENAAILGQYIANVKKMTGAQKVDLLGHSMGGMISRYYIDRLMPDNDVAQLIMLGSPMAGSACANLPAALGYYLPAALEIQPSYMVNIFNPQITHRRGIPFYDLAGTAILEAIASPCTPAPSDIAVSKESVEAIPLDMSLMDILHTDMTISEQAFHDYVLPKLQTPPGGFPEGVDSPAGAAVPQPMQFTRMITGHLDPGSSQDVTINIESNVSVASFALFDTSRSLDIIVHGASGNVITLDPVKNGVTVVDDPETLVYLGYGFNNPKPGAWVVTLLTTDKTPATGADYAITASFEGGATLLASADVLLPTVNQPVKVTARLELGGQPLTADQSQLALLLPDGTTETLALTPVGSDYQATFTPRLAGLYGLQISLAGQTPDGFAVERSDFLTVEAQRAPGLPLAVIGLAAAGIYGVVFVLFAGVVGVMIARRRARRR